MRGCLLRLAIAAHVGVVALLPPPSAAHKPAGALASRKTEARKESARRPAAAAAVADADAARPICFPDSENRS
jgi:hypothetical protein